MIDKTKMEHNLLTSFSPLCGLRTGRLGFSIFRRGRIVEDLFSTADRTCLGGFPEPTNDKERSDEMVPAGTGIVGVYSGDFYARATSSDDPSGTQRIFFSCPSTPPVSLEAETSDMFPADSLESLNRAPCRGWVRRRVTPFKGRA